MSVFKVLVALLVPELTRVYDGMFCSLQLLRATELEQLCRAVPAAGPSTTGFTWALTWAKGHEPEVA